MRSLALAVFLAAAALVPTTAAAQVKRWGSRNGGTVDMQPTPAVMPGLEKVVTIDASNSAGYALESNGTVWAWGNGNFGQLGNGSTAAALTQAVEVKFPAGVRIVSIGEAQNDGYAIDSTGQGWSWGQGEYASLCLGHIGKYLSTPAKVAGVTSGVAVQGGQNHVLWLMANGTVKGCGSNLNGGLGLGEEPQWTSTAMTVPGLEHIVQISAGDRSSAAVDSTGRLFMFGANNHGQIGVGPGFASVYTPMQVALPGPVSQVSCGGSSVGNSHTLVLIGGEVYGWGADKSGQVGDHGNTDKYLPVATGLEFSTVAASGGYSLGLDTEGKVWAWGSGAGEGLGTGSSVPALTPVVVDSGASMISGTAQDSIDG